MNIEYVPAPGSASTQSTALRGRAPTPAGTARSTNEVARNAEKKAAAREAAKEEMRRALADANRQLVQKGNELTFEFNEDADRVVVKLIDTQTREVLRQIPSEEALAIARALRDDAAAGALLRTDA